MERQSLFILTGASKGLGEALKNHLVQLPNTMVIGVSRSPIKAEIRGDKIVVNVSSGAAVKIVDGWSGYSSSKAALNQMTMIAQQESDLKNLGFKMFALSPGIIDTPMQESIRAASQNEFSGLSKFQSFKDNGELSTPDEVAKKVLFLINNPSDFDGVLQDVRKF